MKDQLLRRAEVFARNAHQGQLRTDGQPYIVHPEQTAAILATVTNDQNVIAAGWLHDTIEDCDVTYDQLVQEFNETIADLVLEVTNDGTSNTFPRLESRDATLVKFADRLSNLADMRGWNDKKVKWYLGKSKFWKSA